MVVAKLSGRSSLAGSVTGLARSRVCKKLVLKGQASSRGATYVLYLKLDLTATEPEDVIPLITEAGVELGETHTFCLDASGSVAALSATAVAAAKNLNVSLALSNSSSSQRTLPQVTVRDDGHIYLEACYEPALYLMALHVQVKLLSRPPYGPFVARLPKPFCLNNYLRFTVDESIAGTRDMQDVIVEVDPPILGQRLNSGRSSRASEMGTSDDGDMTVLEPPSDDSDADNDGATVQGPFKSCDAVVLRFASERAGCLVLDDSGVMLPSALKAESATSVVAYTPIEASEQNEAPEGSMISFVASVELVKPYYAGLEHEVFLYLQLDTGDSSVHWFPTAVDASRGIVSWTMGGVPSDDQDEHASPVPQPGRAVDNLVWPDLSTNESVDEEDLFKVAPLSGLNQAGLDFSLDLGAAPADQRSRFALSTSASGNKDSLATNRPLVTPNVLIVGFSLLPLVQSSEPVTISIKGHMGFEPKQRPIYPGLSVPSAQTHPPSQIIVNDRLEPRPDSLQQEIQATEQKVPLAAHTTPLSAEELLQQVLAAVQMREAAVRPKSSATRASFVFRISHLLWTLVLTYMMVSLFTASQTANQALHIKIDHLSRLVEQRMSEHATSVAFSPALADDGQEPWSIHHDAVASHLEVLPSLPLSTKTDVVHSVDDGYRFETVASVLTQTVQLPFAFLRHLLHLIFRI